MSSELLRGIGAQLAIPFVAGVLGLSGSLLTTLALHRMAERAIEETLAARMRGAGETAALLLSSAGLDSTEQDLAQLTHANALESAYLLDPELRISADAAGGSGRRVDLLRIDPERVSAAFAGAASVGPGYAIGELTVISGYFPVRTASRAVTRVLALEGGEAFVAPRQALDRARWLGISLSLLTALALAAVAARYSRTEEKRREAAARAARGETMTKMAAMAAHDIRNPLGVIRGTVELLRERNKEQLSSRDAEALADVLGEVERLRRLTQDFLDLSADKPLLRFKVQLGTVLEDAAGALEASVTGIRVERQIPPSLPPIDGDAGRLRQVLSNLLQNAADAQQGKGTIHLALSETERGQRIEVRDEGPGVPAAIRGSLFDPFVSTRPTGTGLGLAIARQLIERHGGTIKLVEDGRPGACFAIELRSER